MACALAAFVIAHRRLTANAFALIPVHRDIPTSALSLTVDGFVRDDCDKFQTAPPRQSRGTSPWS
jgi:hypothetical protein